ncbi:aspartyl protease family protein [Sphingomonas alpina]|uniref:Aspartyl protease family protein n=1 Tax=Sphingomonas alpina TaxID=653931 RepID=A0A7H0LDU1_9SPHN|nr:aspartyl protease family protein [Sphingomonas alpina]QNQ07844.1 aspartyl protease family protein [Sphingomonas alpina]
MRSLAALFLLLTAATPPADLLAHDAEVRWVPFDLTPGNQIRFTLMVDGKPVSAILDTGVSFSVLSRAYVDAAKLKVRSGGSANAIGGVVPLGWIDTQSITLGGLTRTGGSISVAALPATATGSTRPIEMLVGRDLTAEYALDIDYDTRRFRLLPSGRMPFKGASAPLAVSRDRLVYVSETTVNGRRLRPMIVDTGDGNSVTLSSEAWTTTAMVPTARTSTISFGLGGPIVTDLIIVPELRTGTLVAPYVDVQIEQKGGFSHAMGMAGRIGSGFLQKYRVLLDPKAGHMVLAPGAQSREPTVRSTSGLLVTAESDRLKVLHVMRGGPAERDGWRVGDTICVIDGTPVPDNYPSNPIASWSIGTPGRVVALDLCDGTRRNLTLRHFY